MSKRLQVLIPDAKMEKLRKFARREHLALGDWVRRVLRAARSSRPVQEPQSKLKAVRRATEHSFPTGDLEQMLTEIEQGYKA